MENIAPVAGKDSLDSLIGIVSEAFAHGNTLGDLMAMTHATTSRCMRWDTIIIDRRATSMRSSHFPSSSCMRPSSAGLSMPRRRLQMLKQYENAIAFYSLASVMDRTDPRPTFHTAECLIALGRMEEAIDALTIVIEQSAASEYAALKIRAQGLMDLWLAARDAEEGEKKLN